MELKIGDTIFLKSDIIRVDGRRVPSSGVVVESRTDTVWHDYVAINFGEGFRGHQCNCDKNPMTCWYIPLVYIMTKNDTLFEIFN
jgi:hypothetical protein